MKPFQEGKNFAFPEYKPQYPREYPVKLKHVKAEIKLFPEKKTLTGAVLLTLESKRDMLKTVYLDAVDMEIKEVKVDGEKREYIYDGKNLTIELPKSVNKGKEVKVSVIYETKPVKGVYFILPDGNHPERTLQIYTQGESEDNRYWLPLLDYPNVKSTSELLISVPKNLIVVSNGELLEVEEEGTFKKYHFRMDKPHSTYLISFAAGEFSVKNEEVDGVKLEYFVPKGKEEFIQRSFSKTPDMIKFFSDYTGVKYPYKKYSQVTVSEFMYGGMENITATTLTETTLHDEKAHMDFRSEPLVAHELAHQWFGDLVTTKDWANIWLNESFATYFEALYTRKDLGNEEFLYEMYQNLDSYLKEYSKRYSRPIVTRLYSMPEEVFDAHSYPKGALVLHMLKNLVGEEKFREAIKLYLERFKFSNADTEDFRKVVEEVTGKDMEKFFDYFIYNAGHPVISFSYSFDPEKKLLKLSFKQKQGKDSPETYELPVEVLINNKKYVFNLTDKEQIFYVKTDKKPGHVCVDPEFKLFRVLELETSQEDLINNLSCESIVCRVEGARALAKKRSNKVVKALKEAMLKERFWGVIVEEAKALGEIGTDEALNALLGVETKIKHPKARRAIASALGNFKEERAAETLIKILNDENESYYVRKEAATSLGKTRYEKAFEVLRGKLNVPSHNYSIPSGALLGLSELSTEKSLEIILEYTSKENPTTLRATATQCLGQYPSNKKVYDKLKELAKDENFRVRRAVLLAIETLMDPKLLTLLETMYKTDLDNRVKRGARELSRKIKEFMEKGAEYKRLREELDKVKEENRRILDKISYLETKGT